MNSDQPQVRPMKRNAIHFLRFLLLLTFISIASNIPPKFAFQPGAAVAVPNFIQPEAGCNWSGISGQAFDLSGSPINGLVILLSGSLENQPILKYVLTGSSVQMGPGGYDVILSDKPVASQGSLTVQLQDITGVILSPAIPIVTYASCSQNLIIVNWVQLGFHYYFPIIRKNG